MPVHSWDHFGGHHAEQGGKGFSEAELKQWADNAGFSPAQAQSNLCLERVYAPSYRKALVLGKELMASAVQKHNKAGQPGKVSMIKLKISPMHLLVQKAFCNSKRASLDTKDWASNYFELTSDKLQQQLKDYLQVVDIRKQMPESIMDSADQLAWITDWAATELGQYVQTLLTELSSISVTTCHRAPEAAQDHIQLFRTGNSLESLQWSDADLALDNIKKLIDALGLTAEACLTGSISTALFVAKQRAAGHQSVQPSTQDSDDDAANLDPTQQTAAGADNDHMLHQAAILTRQWVHVFDLDASAPECHVYSPYPSTYKVKLDIKPRAKSFIVNGDSWSSVLGKDPLPAYLLHPGLYQQTATAVMFKKSGTYYVCSQQSEYMSAAPGLSAEAQHAMGLTFVTATYTESGSQLKGGKRGRPPKDKHDGPAKRGPKQRKDAQATPPIDRAAARIEVLQLILSSDYVEADWKDWVEGSDTTDATCQITEQQVDIIQLQQLQARHHSVLQAMHRHKAFDPDAWQALQHTMSRLATEIAEAPSARAGASYDSADTDRAAAAAHAGTAVDDYATEEEQDEEPGYTASANLSGISGACGMVPQRELQEGWRDPASAHRRINAAYTQLRQGATASDLEPFLRELYDCIELDFDICSSMNPAWEESVTAMVTDLASMPASTFSKYWRGAMIFLDWLAHPPAQEGGPDAFQPREPQDGELDEDEAEEEASAKTPEEDAERVIQDKLAARFVTTTRFCRFIKAIEQKGPRDLEAEEEVELTKEQISEIARQYGMDLKDARDLLAMRKTMSREAFRDLVNACGYLQILQNAFAKGEYQDRTEGLWKQAIVRRIDKQKRRMTGFLKAIAVSDASYRHIQTLTTNDIRVMALGFLEVAPRVDPFIAIRCGAMYMYMSGMWTRAEDPRNRTLSDMFVFEYPPTGRPGGSRIPMESVCFSKDTGKTTSPTGHWEVQTFTHHKDWLLSPVFWLSMWMVSKYEAPGWKGVVPFPNVLAGRAKGYGLQRVFHNAKTPYKAITPATHGYQTDSARRRAERLSYKNTYEPRAGRPNALVASGTNPKWIEKAGWFADLGTFDRHYEKVHHPDLVAQPAGYLDREDYAPNLGLDPDEHDEFKEMSSLLWAWLPSQVEQLRQFNLKAPRNQRDLGGLMLLQTFVVLKRTWWQLAPRLEMEVPGHPIFRVEFMEEARFSGLWDRWVQVVLQYHSEVDGLLRAMSGPLWSMIGLASPHMIVARLLEPVHEAIRKRQGPETVMLTHIWRLSGEILLDVPDCPVQLAEAVYSLMGRDPPAPETSPAQQSSEREARIREALDGLSLTARTERERQQAQRAQPQAGAPSSSSNNPEDTPVPSGQLQAFEQLQRSSLLQMEAAVAALAPTDPASQTPEQKIMSQMAAAFVNPLLQMYKEQQLRDRTEVQRLSAKLARVEAKLDSIESKLDSNASFYPLVAVAMGSLTHQVHGLAQYLAANFREGSARPAQLSPMSSPRKLATTPQRKAMQRQENARIQAKRQIQEAKEKVAQQQQAGATPVTAGHGQTASRLRIVYPGSDGEPYWCEWKGRFRTLTAYPSWKNLLGEWKEGIQLGSGTSAVRKTVPLMQLEKDKQEGVQRKSTSTFKSPKVPWRQGILDRNIIRDRKILIYGMLQLEHDGENLEEVMGKYEKQAEKAIKDSSQSRGANTTVLTYIKNLFEQDERFLSPTDFEMEVLGWKLTPTVLAQAASKKRSKEPPPYPPAPVSVAL